MEWVKINPFVWNELSLAAARHPNMVAAEPLTYNGTAPCYICIFVSSDRSLHLLISPEEPMQEQLIDPRAAGLNLTILPNLLVLGRDRQHYIDLRCTARPHIVAYTEIVKEIARQILKEGLVPTKAVNLVIRRWKSFWGRPAGSVLSETEQLGLLGELIVLERLITYNVPAPVSAWVGPLGGVHDFELFGASFEVKTTTRSRHKHLINGIEQLETIKGYSLAIISFLTGEVDTGGTFLLEQVRKINQLLNHYPDYYEQFNERLLMTGFSYEHSSYYERNQYVVQDIRVFPVSYDFPGIISSSFKAPPSPRVTEIRYLLDLEGLPSFSMESKEFADLIK